MTELFNIYQKFVRYVMPQTDNIWIYSVKTNQREPEKCIIELKEDIKDNQKKYLEDMNLFNYEIGDLIDKSKTFNYLLEKIDEDEVKNEISQFMVMQKV